MVLYKFLFPTAKLYPKPWDIRPKSWDIHPKVWDIRPKAWDIEIWWDIKTLPVGFANFYGWVGIIVGYGWYNATVGEYDGMYMGQKQKGESRTCCTFALYYIV